MRIVFRSHVYVLLSRLLFVDHISIVIFACRNALSKGIVFTNQRRDI